MSKKVKIKETATVKKPVVIKEAPKTIMSCGNKREFVFDERPMGIVISFPYENVTKEQAVICFKKIAELLEKSDKKAISICWQEYYESGDAEDMFWD